MSIVEHNGNADGYDNAPIIPGMDGAKHADKELKVALPDTMGRQYSMSSLVSYNIYIMYIICIDNQQKPYNFLESRGYRFAKADENIPDGSWRY